MDKIKDAFAALKEKVGTDALIAAGVIFILLLIHPVLAVVGGLVYVAWKSGKLDKFLAKFKD